MKTELFKKVYIHSEEDLPKEMGDYLVLRKIGYGTLLHFPFEGDVGWKADRYNWLHNVDWYLLPVPLPSDDEIVGESNKVKYRNIPDYDGVRNGFRAGVTWLKSRLTDK